ncbi:unnamed protein product [Rodentolepis nana]|uniref:Uncharacterized protein n=1 Tax=Rodentolepis nana TaxID=102285 RepID=A0A0R3TMD3_RODNA|nr:unnamed protein product [Rodentolepis nana]
MLSSAVWVPAFVLQYNAYKFYANAYSICPFISVENKRERNNSLVLCQLKKTPELNTRSIHVSQEPTQQKSVVGVSYELNLDPESKAPLVTATTSRDKDLTSGKFE